MATNNNKIVKGYVLLFKTAKEDYVKDPYVEELEEAGFSAVCASALGFKFINQDELWSSLKNVQKYAALILTSQRAVESIQKVIAAHKDEGQAVLKEWKKLTTYVVGVSTGEAAEKLGLTSTGEDAGSSEKLAEMVIEAHKEVKDPKPLFFPGANIKLEKIPQKLEAEGVPFHSIISYETEASGDISKSLELLIKEQGIPEYIVYFSPSGIQFTIDELKSLDYPLDTIKFIALGRSTKRRIEQANLVVTATASNPTVSALVKTIKEVHGKTS